MNQDQQLRDAAQKCISFRIGNMGNYSELAVMLMSIRLAFQSLATPERVLELLDEIDSLRATLTATQQADRDNEWVMAMAEALGTNSGFTVPIVPDSFAFRALFADIAKKDAALK